MRPADLTAVEIADQLHAAYQEDRRLAPDGPDEDERIALADYLGCHEEIRAEAWAVWRTVLELEGLNLSDAEYWLDVEFVEPCPEDRPV